MESYVKGSSKNTDETEENGDSLRKSVAGFARIQLDQPSRRARLNACGLKLSHRLSACLPVYELY